MWGTTVGFWTRLRLTEVRKVRCIIILRGGSSWEYVAFYPTHHQFFSLAISWVDIATLVVCLDKMMILNMLLSTMMRSTDSRVRDHESNFETAPTNGLDSKAGNNNNSPLCPNPNSLREAGSWF